MSWLLTAYLFFFLALSLHPFVTYPATLRLVPPVRRRARCANNEAGPESPETFALCLCAYNEEAVIERKIENMLDLRRRRPDLEILVYVDAATDGTAALLERVRDRITLVVSPERNGRPSA